MYVHALLPDKRYLCDQTLQKVNVHASPRCIGNSRLHSVVAVGERKWQVHHACNVHHVVSLAEQVLHAQQARGRHTTVT